MKATGPRWGVRHTVAGFLAFAAASAYLTRHCLAVANTSMQADLGFNNQEFGYLYSAFSVGYLLCQIPGGWLGQRFGTRLVMPTLSMLWSCFTMVVAGISTLAGIIAARFAFGLCQAGLIPNQAQVVKDWFPLDSRGSISGIIAMSMSIGGVITMALTGWLLESYHWRTIFRAYSLVGIAWAVAFYWFFRSHPSQHPAMTSEELQRIEPTTTGAAQKESAQGLTGEGETVDWTWLRQISIWALCGQMLCKAAGYNFFVTFFPAFLEYAYGLHKSAAGILTAWPLVGVVFGSLLGGWLVDVVFRKTGSPFLSRSGVAISTLGVTALLTLASTIATTAESLTIVIGIGAFFSGLSMAAPWVAIVDVSGKNAAIGMGLMNSAGCFAGILISPAIGRLIDSIKATNGDWNQVIYAHAAFYAIAAAFWCFVRPRKRECSSTLTRT